MGCAFFNSAFPKKTDVESCFLLFLGLSDDDEGMVYDRTLPDEHEPEALDAPTLTAKRDMLAKDLREASERLQKEREARQSAAGAAEPTGATGPADDGDSLEAFMRGVDARLESDELFVLERRAQELERELEATKKLLHLADPDGYDCVCYVLRAGQLAGQRGWKVRSLPGKHMSSCAPRSQALLVGVKGGPRGRAARHRKARGSPTRPRKGARAETGGEGRGQ